MILLIFQYNMLINFSIKKGNNSAARGAIELVIELDRDIMPIYTPTKFHKVEVKTV